jgi:hypothetical protein
MQLIMIVCTKRYARKPNISMPAAILTVELTAPRCQVRRYLPEKQRYTVELLEPPAGGGAGRRMDVQPANFALAHLSAGTRCVRARRLSSRRSGLWARRVSPPGCCCLHGGRASNPC